LETAVNLRGLGARATLVLIDGRRAAPSGSDASFVDIENIPKGLIDHIDILTDGGSAFYGTDSVDGMVNVVLRDRFSGVEILAESGDATQGGQSYLQLTSRAGTRWDTGRVFADVDWYRRDALPADKRPFMNPNLTPEG
jgi:iron complex outermembrane receptor protein